MGRRKDPVIWRWRITDFVLGLSSLAWTFVPSDEATGSSLGSIAVTVAAASLTISIFVCTMNYTDRSEGVDVLVSRHGPVFRARWSYIFTASLIALALPIVGVLVKAVSLSLGCVFACLSLAISLLQAWRAIRLLLMLVDARQAADERQQAESRMRQISKGL